MYKITTTAIEFSTDTRSTYKNQLYFYILAIDMWKLKLKYNAIYSHKRIKYIGVNLTGYVQNLYAKNFQRVMKEIKDYLNK